MQQECTINLYKKPSRKSGVELFKIFGILLVVISHVVQTLGTEFEGYTYTHDLTANTTNPTYLFLALLRYSGALGNSIFFICSAWFLLDSSKTNKQKILRMLSDIWIISILWLVVSLSIPGIDVTNEMLWKSFIPTLAQNNWYTTTYIIFCFFYPLLNIIIKNCDQKKLFTISLSFFLTYILIVCFGGFQLASNLTLWIAIYFVIAYFKLYGLNICRSFKINLILLTIGLVGNICMLLGANILGYIFPALANGLQVGSGNANFFHLLIAFSGLNLSLQMKFSSKFINYISSLSLLVYVIHENIIFRGIYRPIAWQWIYDNLGYNNILLWTLLYVILLFISSILLATLYKFILQKPIHFLSDYAYKLFTKIGNFFANWIYKFKN